MEPRFRSSRRTKTTPSKEARDQSGFLTVFNSVIVDPKRIEQIIEHLCGWMNHYLKITERPVGSTSNLNGHAAIEIGETHEVLSLAVGCYT